MNIKTKKCQKCKKIKNISAFNYLFNIRKKNICKKCEKL